MHVNPAWRPTCQSVKRTLANESSESRRVSRARNVLTKRRARFSFCVPVLVDDHDGDGLQWTYAGLTYLTHRAAVPYLAHVNTITCPAYLLPSSLVLLLDRISYSLSLSRLLFFLFFFPSSSSSFSFSSRPLTFRAFSLVGFARIDRPAMTLTLERLSATIRVP